MSNKDTATQAFEAAEDQLRQISRSLYDHPELAFQEHESSTMLAEFLGSKGMEVEHPAYGLDTAFEATAGSEGPKVVICCEYDALPEVGQACGHNIIATAAAGAGVAAGAVAESLGIQVTVLGTPAEEGGGGKVKLLEAGAFENVAASMMIHPFPTDIIDKSFQAARSFRVEFVGKESHAAFAPHLGVNALDGFVQAYLNVATLRQHFMGGDVTHCILNHGGDASNIIPAHTSSTWGIRARTGERLDELVTRIRSCWEAAAQATGCELVVTPIGELYLDVITNPLLATLYQANSEAIGRPMPEEPVAEGGSTDMGNVSYVVPSIHPMVAIDANGAVNHQKEFADATVTPSGDQAIRDGALAMAHTIIDLAEQNLWEQL